MAVIVSLVLNLTFLDNYNLSGQSTLNQNTSELIQKILSSLPTPICLVTNYGNTYDFPRLKAELDKLGTQLDADILCADSYVGIKEVFNQKAEMRDKLTKENIIEVNDATEIMKAGMFEMNKKKSDN